MGSESLSDVAGRFFKLLAQTNDANRYSSPAGRQSLQDFVLSFSPAIIVFAVTVVLSYFAGTAEGLSLVQSNIRTLVRFLAITTILLVPLLILPPFMVFVGSRLTEAGFLGRLVKGETGSIPFRRSILWIIRPLQGIGMSMIFFNQLLTLFRTYPEASFIIALIRPMVFIAVSVPISILFSIIWSLDDLDVKLYNEKTGEVRLVGSYIGTILPVISGSIGIYSLFQHGSPTEALLLLTLIVMVLYPPYVLFAVTHDKFLTQRKAKFFENLLLSNVEVQVTCRTRD